MQSHHIQLTSPLGKVTKYLPEGKAKDVISKGISKGEEVMKKGQEYYDRGKQAYEAGRAVLGKYK